MNWLKIIGIVFIVLACMEILSVISDYQSGKLQARPFGVEFGAALFIAAGIFLIRRGNRPKDRMKI